MRGRSSGTFTSPPEALQRIAMLYANADRIGGCRRRSELRFRQSDLRPLIEGFKPFGSAHGRRKSRRKSALHDPLHPEHWESPRSFIDDGRVEIDGIERSIKPMG
jgi:hypothetical protein